jgi:hypothetical protein
VTLKIGPGTWHAHLARDSGETPVPLAGQRQMLQKNRDSSGALTKSFRENFVYFLAIVTRTGSLNELAGTLSKSLR